MGLDFRLGGAIAFVFLVLALTITVSAQDDYLRAYVPDYIPPNETVWIAGEAIIGGGIFNGTINITITNSTGDIVNHTLATTNSSTGAFNLSITLPNYEDRFTVNVSSNSTILGERTCYSNTSYFQDASMEFIGNQPPFAPGDSITVKTTVKHQNGTILWENYTVTMGIYSGNGKIASWGAESSNTTISDGTTTHSFTIAASAEPGDYIADMYGKHLIFTIKKYSVAGITLDNNSQSAAFFAPDAIVDIRTKVKNASDDPQTGAEVYATIVYPNGTELDPIELTNTSDGIYDYNFSLPSATGTYTVRINSTIGSVVEETQSSFTVQDVKLSLERSTYMDFFDMWGGDKVISPGSNASFDLKVFDLSTGEFLPVDNDGGGSGVNCSSLEIVDVTRMATRENATSNVTGEGVGTATSLKFMGESLCTVTFKTPAAAGVYRITLNVTVNSSTTYNQKSATGYFTTQNYKLKVIPITVMGRDQFHVLLRPGKNASFKLEVRNITAKSTLTTPNISNVEVTSLTSMGEFSFGGASDTRGIDYWYDSTNKKITAFIPENLTGPTLIKVQAIYQVSGTENETLTGDGFFFAKYVMGFVGPQFGGMMSGEGEMEEGGMDGPGGGPMGMGGTAMDCSSMMQFQGFVMDVETQQPQESVVIKKGIIREELTGKDVSACFTVIGGGGKTDSSGQVSLNMTFAAGAGCPYSAATELSGFYFLVWDAKWQNYTDSLPGGFECKNFNFWPYMTQWDLGPNSTINFTISNVVYMNNMSKQVTNGTVSLARLMNFDPSKGPTILDLTNAPEVNISGNLTYYAFYPANFTVLEDNNNGEWYSGFYDCMIRVCDNNNTASSADDTCDTSFGGFGVFPFKAYIMSSDVWGSSYNWQPGETKTIEIWSENNITQNITIKRMDFMTGEQVDITLIQNLTADYNEGQNITVNFTLPSDLKKGDGMIMFTLTDANSDQVTTDVFAQIKTFTVISPQAPWPGETNIQVSERKFRLEGYGYEQTNATLNITDPAGSEFLGNIGDLDMRIYTNGSDGHLFNLTRDIRAWDLDTIWTNHSLQSSRYDAAKDPGYGGYCLFENLFNRSEHILVIDNGTPNSQTPADYSHIFIKYNGTNGSDSISGSGYSLRGPYAPGDYIGNGIYLRGFEYCFPFLYASNITDYTTLVGEEGQLSQYWSSEWAWGGRHRVNDNFTLPFYVEWVNGSKDVGANVTVTQIGGMNFDKKGFTAPLTAGQFFVRDNTTDSQGIAQVMLNISTSGMYRAFWWVNSSTSVEETASFDNGIVFQISAFECYGQWLSDTGSGMEGVMVETTDNVTGMIMAAHFNQTSIENANISLYYMDFSNNFGPPIQTDLSLGSDLYYLNGTLMPATDTLATNSSGQLIVTIKPSGRWPTSSYGACVELQGTATAEISGTPTVERFFVGRVCTYPV